MMLNRFRAAVAPLLAGLLLFATADPVRAQDRHDNYYYPEVTSSEVYQARAQVLPNADRTMRVGFIVAQTTGQVQGRPYPPRFAMFAKGEQAEKMIIIGLDDTSFATLFRARAVLAQMTSISRGTELFRSFAVEDYFTFFDLARMLGFTQITVSDGETYAHRVDLE